MSRRCPTCCIADFQSVGCPATPAHPSERSSCRLEALRYGRLDTCATSHPSTRRRCAPICPMRPLTIDNQCYQRYPSFVNVSLPQPWEEFVASQVTSGEFGNASEVVREALRLLRDQREAKALEEMRTAFAGVDSQGGQGEPS